MINREEFFNLAKEKFVQEWNEKGDYSGVCVHAMLNEISDYGIAVIITEDEDYWEYDEHVLCFLVVIMEHYSDALRKDMLLSRSYKLCDYVSVGFQGEVDDFKKLYDVLGRVELLKK